MHCPELSLLRIRDRLLHRPSNATILVTNNPEGSGKRGNSLT